MVHVKMTMSFYFWQQCFTECQTTVYDSQLLGSVGKLSESSPSVLLYTGPQWNLIPYFVITLTSESFGFQWPFGIQTASSLLFCLHYCTQNLIMQVAKPLAARNEGVNPIEKTSWFAVALDEITRWILREKADCKQSIWHSAKHICPSPLTENTLRVHVLGLAHLQSLFVSLLLCISATKT